MTEQDKVTIFDVLIKPFLRADSLTAEHEEDNLFVLAIHQLLNSSLRAQQDEHLGCERYDCMSTRNGQYNGFKPRFIRTSIGQITLGVPQVRNTQTPFTPPSFWGLKEVRGLTGLSTSLLLRCTCKVSLPAKSPR